MRAAEIASHLQASGLPVAYRFFPDGDAQDLPYVVWYIGGEVPFAADGENYCNIKQLTVELYTKVKDLAAEEDLELVLPGVWSKTEEYLEDEKCFQIVYYLEV